MHCTAVCFALLGCFFTPNTEAKALKTHSLIAIVEDTGKKIGVRGARME